MTALEGITPLLLHREEDIRYFSGSYSNGFLFITKQDSFLITADSNTEARAVVIESRDYYKDLFFLTKKLGIKKVFACTDSMPHKMFSKLGKKIKVLNAEERVDKIRSVKNEKEIKHVKKASKLAVESMKAVRDSIKTGISEKELAKTALCSAIDKSDDRAFRFIVSSGKNSLSIHPIPTGKKIEEGETVIVDIGFKANGYCSDMTRTFAINPSREQEKTWGIVKEAYDIALKKIKKGVKCKEPVIAVKRFFKQQGVLDCWKYSLGHGVGLSIHEKPLIISKSREVFKSNMTIAIEPGLHIPGLGGFRLENTILIKNKNITLTKMDSEMRV